MKVKVLVRNPDDYLRETKHDIYKLPRNYDPALHPLETPREYTRALNAVKVERLLARPFIGALDGHSDSVSCFGKHPKRLSSLYSAGADGELKLWDVARQKTVCTVQAHSGYLRNMAFTHEGKMLYTVGDDKLIKQWKVEEVDGSDMQNPVNTIVTKYMLTGITHHRKKPYMATCGEACQLWDHNRAQPIKTYQWGVDSLKCIKFNQIESNVLAACGQDRSIILYDIRDNLPFKKATLKLGSNSLCWNPMEAYMFVVANEDYNLYSFDMRNLSKPSNIFHDHVSAVIDVDFSPTGKEIASASYDKTLRIFPSNKSKSRDIYHTKRMQRLTCVAWSLDDRYVFSGSSEMNIRIWKARASEKLGVVRPREKMAQQVNAKLVDKFAQHPEVKRIRLHRHVPRHVYNARKEHAIIRQKLRRKDYNYRTKSKLDLPVLTEKEKVVVKEDEDRHSILGFLAHKYLDIKEKRSARGVRALHEEADVMATAAAPAAGAAPTVAGDEVTAPIADVLLVGEVGAKFPPLDVTTAGFAADKVESKPTPLVFKLTVTLMAPIADRPTVVETPPSSSLPPSPLVRQMFQIVDNWGISRRANQKNSGSRGSITKWFGFRAVDGVRVAVGMNINQKNEEQEGYGRGV
nr:EOG090X04WU [Macrothrix elegans]